MVLKHWKKSSKALTLLHQEMLEGIQPKQTRSISVSTLEFKKNGSENNSKSK